MLIPNKTLGKNIAHYRKERKLSQAKLAAIVGIEDNHLSRIETGRVVTGIITLARLASELGVAIDELVGRREVDS